jgi:hypothetical protein
VADAADGLDRRQPGRAVDLLVQVADVDVDDVRASLYRAVPGLVEQGPARDGLPRLPHERLEQPALLLRQTRLALAAAHRARRRSNTRSPTRRTPGRLPASTACARRALRMSDASLTSASTISNRT